MVIYPWELTSDQMYYYLMDLTEDLPNIMRKFILTNYDKALKLSGGVLDVEVNINKDLLDI